jgi:hypothetical protein
LEAYQHKDGDKDKAQVERAELAPKPEIALVDEFLSHFVYGGTSTKKGEQIDLPLTLKALPARIDMSNYWKVELYDFRMI